jgi:hypothetical protein
MCRAGRRRSSRSRRSKLPRLGLVAVALGLATGGCGGGSEPEPERAPNPVERRSGIDPVRCPDAAGNCRSATGRIVYIEGVDPDGDGDAHFVLLSDESITAPGISAIDVARELRPEPLPQPGDLLSAAGPVYRGSFGQRQIEATALNTRRRP